MLVVLLATVLSYTVPRFEGPTDCRPIVVSCDSVMAVCDTLPIEWPERMASVEVWWAPRNGRYGLMRVKPVAGLEGQRDTLQVPSDTIATVYLVAVDSAGNRSCRSNHVTVNLPPVGVAPVVRGQPEVRWYDLAGRRLAEQPRRSGVYFRREVWGDSLSVKRIVILR